MRKKWNSSNSLSFQIAKPGLRVRSLLDTGRGLLGSLSGPFGGVLWVVRGLLGGSWCLLGPSRESLEASGGRLESLCENLGAILGQSARKAWGGPLFWLPLGARAEGVAGLDR